MTTPADTTRPDTAAADDTGKMARLRRFGRYVRSDLTLASRRWRRAPLPGTSLLRAVRSSWRRSSAESVRRRAQMFALTPENEHLREQRRAEWAAARAGRLAEGPRTYTGPVEVHVAYRGVSLEDGADLAEWVADALVVDSYYGGTARARLTVELLPDPPDSDDRPPDPDDDAARSGPAGPGPPA